MKNYDFHFHFLHSNVVAQLKCGGYVVHCLTKSSVRMKHIQSFLQLGKWLWRNCMLSAGVFLSHPTVASLWYGDIFSNHSIVKIQVGRKTQPLFFESQCIY